MAGCVLVASYALQSVLCFQRSMFTNLATIGKGRLCCAICKDIDPTVVFILIPLQGPSPRVQELCHVCKVWSVWDCFQITLWGQNVRRRFQGETGEYSQMSGRETDGVCLIC